LPALVVPSAVLGSTVAGIACGAGVADGELPVLGALLLLAVVATFMMWLLSLELRVEERAAGLDVHYAGLKRRRVPWSDIVSAEARTFRPLLEHGGWGIRYAGRRCWAYTAAGNHGVLLKLADGSRLLVGTARPGELEAAIRARIAGA